PDYISREEWNNLPKDMLLRRISYKYPTKEGMETAVLYTTLLSERIEKTEIILKYTTRWDIEICIREVKTLMDINVLRAKTSDMLEKELAAALIAYNLVRHLIYRAAQKGDFPSKKNIFRQCSPFNHPILLDRKGRVFHHWSPGRNRKAVD
ncbi:MAG: transposase, partial [Prevotellaceae bacterium]|nr:transposase [Prevotellaceae bacterium]